MIDLNSILEDKKIELNSNFDTFVKSISSLDCSDKRTELMKSFAASVGSSLKVEDIEPSTSDTYDRNYLCRHESGWEMMLIVWRKDDFTNIHGHPEMCCYFYIEGEFKLDIFDLCPEGNPILKKELHVSGGDSYADCGEPNSYCNHIHRVKCLSPKGMSINIYSDDAQKGTAYIYND